jgi:hypothetical protein
MRSPLLVVHIVSGTLGVLSGFVAVFLRKGSRQHALAGNVFVISMLSLGASGTILAIMKSQVTNVLGGVLTFYLVSTAWATARRRGMGTNILDWMGLLFALAVGVTQLTLGIQAVQSQTGLRLGYPPGIYFFMGAVVLLAATGDIRMLVRGGISGTPRIARHLWRMCFGLFIAASSIFIARPQLFPAILQKTGTLAFLSFLPLLLMVFWLIRVRFKNAYKVNGKATADIRPNLSHKEKPIYAHQL